MLSFLRKIRKDPLGGNRTSKYLMYAVGEITLVVIGILIALQINNWNEWRKERKKEIEVLQDLKVNLENNIQLFNSRLIQLNKRDSSSIIIINVIKNKLPFNDTLGEHFHRAERGHGGADKLSYVGYENLKNAGFDIILNKPLKEDILKLFEITYPDLIDIDNQFDRNDVYHIELIDKFFYKNQAGSSIPHSYQKLLNDPSYYGMITRLQLNRRMIIERSIYCLEQTQKLLQLIEDELGDE